MFNRIVSIALIAAVFGCPLWCSMGMCQCDGVQSSVQVETTLPHCCTPPCCSATAETGDSPCHSDNSCPQRKPDSLRCQGICGGAVVESPCQLPALELCLLLPTNDDHHSFLTRPRCGVLEPDFPDCIRGKNQGRSVRIRQMSFLC